MHALRTPDARFADLPDWPFAPRYHELASGLRVHFVDEGPPAARPVLMLHGEPSWSYLYRHMIPPVVAAGARVVAPDLVGFGRSDKPTDPAVYTYAQHVAWMREWLVALDLRDVTLVCQDWGSLVGLRLAAENPDRFAAIVLANGGLPTGDAVIPRAFRIWRSFASYWPWFPTGRIVAAGTKRRLDPRERRAYDAPFPGSAYQAGARAFPRLVPITPDDPAAPANRRAWQVFEGWTKPFVTCFSDGDPITRGFDRAFRERVPGARSARHATLHGGHFVQEDDPQAFAQIVVETWRSAGSGAEQGR